PFFVREVLRHLAETGAIERREGRWLTRPSVEELGIPESVRDVVGRRLSRLSEAAIPLLRVAAVIGAEFEVPVLEAAGNLDEEALVYYRQALQLLEVAQGPPDEVRRCELLISLGEAQRRAGDAMYRNTLLRAARLAQELDYPDALARAALANHRGYFSVVERI